MSRKYLTQNEIDNIEFRIYNNLPTLMDEDVSEVHEIGCNEEIAKELAKGIEYTVIEEDERYILTKQGRLFNTQRLNSIKPVALSEDLQYILANRFRLSYKENFERAGWEWDYKKILQAYRKNGWKIKLHEPARRLLEE